MSCHYLLPLIIVIFSALYSTKSSASEFEVKFLCDDVDIDFLEPILIDKDGKYVLPTLTKSEKFQVPRFVIQEQVRPANLDVFLNKPKPKQFIDRALDTHQKYLNKWQTFANENNLGGKVERDLRSWFGGNRGRELFDKRKDQEEDWRSCLTKFKSENNRRFYIQDALTICNDQLKSSTDDISEMIAVKSKLEETKQFVSENQALTSAIVAKKEDYASRIALLRKQYENLKVIINQRLKPSFQARLASVEKICTANRLKLTADFKLNDLAIFLRREIVTIHNSMCIAFNEQTSGSTISCGLLPVPGPQKNPTSPKILNIDLNSFEFKFISKI